MAVLLTLSLVLVGKAAPGDLDTTPGGGTVATDFGSDDGAFALVLQRDGKLVAAGIACLEGGGCGFALARFLPNGRLDSSFGVGGKVITDFGGGVAFALGLVLQPDGKLVAAGYADSDFAFDFALARYLPDGRLDPSFGVGGKVLTDFDGYGDVATALVLQPDGKLVAAGGVTDIGGTASVWGLARYLPDGRLDPSFGVGGKVLTTNLTNEAKALDLQPDGKLVAAGQIINGTGVLARYLPDGRLDPTFGVGGIATTDLEGGEDLHALVLQPDGKLVAAGDVARGDIDPNDFALARYLPDGRLDSTFGTGGTVTTDFGDVFAVAYTLVLQSDGKLVAAGLLGATDWALARYLPDGSLDPSFGVGGKVTTDFGGTGGANALVLQPDGKLVGAGVSFASGSGDFALARYLPDGRLDPIFETGFEIIVNELVSFVIQSTSLNPNPVSGGPAGVFTITARLTNTSTENIHEPVNAIVKTLTNGNKLLSATEGNGGASSKQAIDAGSDDTLIPNESRTVQFRIGLANRNRFSFFVDVSGIVGGDD